MSADDFQIKYASVMESMLKSAVAETTKLFETMVDELKAEISRIKKENEELKTRCSRFESARSQPTVHTRESEPLPAPRESPEKRDTAVQCDLVPFRTMLVEQCQPLGHPSPQNQKQQCRYKETEYTLQEHDYETHGEGNSQVAFIFVKQESVLNQEEVKSTMVCGHVLSDKADSPWASACENENEGPFINEIYSTREIPLPQRHEETQMALELPFLGTYSGLQGAQNQSPELEHSLVISLAAIKDDMEEESEVSKGSKPVNEQTDVILQQGADVQSTQEQLAQPTPLKKGEACDGLKYGVAEVEASSQPDLSVRHRRGRPPKKAKHLQPPVKEIFQPLSSDTPTEQEIKKFPKIRMEEVEVSSAVDTVNITSSEPPQSCPVHLKESSSIITLAIQERTNTALEDVENSKVGSLEVSVVSLSKRCSSEKETPSESQQFSMDMEEGAIQDLSTDISTVIETPAESPQAPSVQPRERCTSVTLQDAMLLVEAMNQSTVKNTFSSPQRTAAAPPQTHCAPRVGALQTVDKVPTKPQTPPLAVETHEIVGNIPITELSTTTQSTIEKCCAGPQTTDATPTSEAQAHIKVVIPKQQHTVSLSSTATSSVPPSTAATQCATCVQSFQQHRPHLLITSVAPSRRGSAVIIVPRSVSSLMPRKIAALSSTQLPTVTPTVVAAQNNILLPGSTAAGLPLGTSCPVPQKTISVASSKLLPVVTQLTTTSTDPESGTLLHPKKTIIIPRQVSAVESRKHQSQTIVQTAQQESAKSAAPVLVSRLISLSQKLSVSVDKQTASNEVVTISSQERDNTFDNLKSPKQTAPVSTNAHTETCSSLNMSVGLVPTSVSPDAQDPKKASSNDSVDGRASSAETSTSDKRRLQKNSFLTQLRSHIKTHLQARRTETNAEPHAETETHTVSPKKPRLENDHPKDKSTIIEPIPLGPKTTGAVEDVTSLKRATNDPTPISPRRSGLCKDGVKPKRTVSESSSVTSRRSKATPWRSSSGRDVGFKSKKSTSVNPRRSSSTKESVTPKKTKNTSVHPRRTSSSRDGVSPKNTKTGGSPNNTNATSVRPKRTSSSRDGASPKKTKSPSVSPGTSGLSKNGTSPKISTNESFVSRRRCTFSKDVACTNRESNSFGPRRCSTTTDGSSSKNIKSETDSPSVGWPKLAKDGVRLTKAVESTSVKKLSLIQDGTSLKKNLRVVNTRKLGKAVKAKRVAKIKNSNQSELQNGEKTSQLVENRASCEAAKKCMVKAVWTPPRMPTGKTPPAGAKRSVRLPVKKETRSPRSQDHTVVYPPSVSLHPIPVKAPPIVSPLQPLSVIGWRLLKNQCGECGRVLSSSAALESHVSLHTGRRPFSCTLCGKRFADSKALKRHGRVHRNGRIHICQQCGKGFVYRFGLTKHLQMVHRKIKPFVCQICNKGFFTKIDVEAHIRIHTGEKPFHCNLCEKKFTRRVELNVHLRWHNGEKRHWCPYCGKGFLDFNNLKRHKYIHTGEKPHSCPHCPKNFTQSGHLKKHVKNVHKIQ